MEELEELQTDDVVLYDDDLGVVVSRYPSSEHAGFDVDVFWVATRKTTTVWESDLARVTPTA